MSDLYVKCPRCEGDREVYAITSPGNDYFPSRGEYFSCPLCSGTGEADAEKAKEYKQEMADLEE